MHEARTCSNLLTKCGFRGRTVGVGTATRGRCGRFRPVDWALPLIAAAFHSTLTAKANIVVWGQNPAIAKNLPAISSNIVTVAAGPYHALALDKTGRVLAWGENQYGQCNVPTELANATAIAAGTHSLALTAEGTVVAWGDNSYGQTNVPSDLKDVLAIAAGPSHSLALKSGGAVVAWGRNSEGQTQVPVGLTNVAGIAAGERNSLAVTGMGTLMVWGDNSSGQCDIPAGSGEVKMGAAGFAHVVALRLNGTVMAWGDNSFGQSSVPLGLTNVVAVAAAGNSSVALRADGSLVLWGQNSSEHSKEVAWLTNATAIATAGEYGLAVIPPPLQQRPYIVFLSQSDQIVTFGWSFTLQVQAAGSQPLSYSWEFEGSPVVGQTNSTFSLTNVSGANSGTYFVVVSNEFGMVRSGSLQVTVLDPLIVGGAPSQSVHHGGTVNFYVLAQGTPPFWYQWYKDEEPLPGRTDWQLVLTNIGSGDVGKYFATVTNAYGSTPSSVVELRLDSTVADSFSPWITGDSVNCLAIQPDGKILAAGSFTSVAGEARTNLIRLNPDGSLDRSFNPQAGADGPAVNSVIVQPTGEILIGGRFNSIGGEPRTNFARLLPDGSVDPVFNPGATEVVAPWAVPEVDCLAVDTSGRILVGGTFDRFGGQQRSCIARLNTNGTLDESFNPGADYIIRCIAVQPDGKVFVSGKFTILAGKRCTNLGRLNTDGTFDDSFKVEIAGGAVETITVQADGKILIGGGFETVGGEARRGLARLNPDGTVDLPFQIVLRGEVFSAAEQADGRFLIAGWAPWSVSGPGVFRIERDGRVDTSFTPSVDGAYCLSLQNDGKVVVGGRFTSLSGQARSCIGRLETTDPARQTLSFNPSSIVWQCSGTAPEFWHATFAYSTNGVNWIGPVTATRVTNGWERSGLSLPVQAKIKAQGFIAAGLGGRSSWVVESSTEGAPEFGKIAVEPGSLNLTFSTLPGVNYRVEYRDSLITGSWNLLKQFDGSGKKLTLTDITTASEQRFYRLSVSWQQ